MNSLKPKFSGDVNVDELFVKIDGQMKYFFAALDPNTQEHNISCAASVQACLQS
jgi:transposase-like protein